MNIIDRFMAVGDELEGGGFSCPVQQLLGVVQELRTAIRAGEVLHIEDIAPEMKRLQMERRTVRSIAKGMKENLDRAIRGERGCTVISWNGEKQEVK